MTRTVAYYSLVATGAIDTRKMSMEKFMPLDDHKKMGVSDEAFLALHEAQKLAMAEALNQTL